MDKACHSLLSHGWKLHHVPVVPTWAALCAPSALSGELARALWLLLLGQCNINPVMITHTLPLRVKADLTRGCGGSQLPELAWKRFYSFSWKQTCDCPCPRQDSSALCPQGH